MQKYPLLLSCLPLAVACGGKSEVKPQKPNIVIVLADDMGFGDVPSNNPEAKTKMPNVDKMISQGVNFTEAHSGSALSTPSRYGLLTGRSCLRSKPEKGGGAWGYLKPQIEKGRSTIASMLKKAGYQTAIVGKYHLGMEWAKTPEGDYDFSAPTQNGPNSYGFDYSFVLPGSLDMQPYVFVRNGQVIDPEIIQTTDVYPTTKEGVVEKWDTIHAKKDGIYWGRGVWWRKGNMSKSFRVEECLTDIAKEGIAYIDRAAKNPEKPFFLYFPLPAPHTPWMPRPEFKDASQVGNYGDYVYNVDDVLGQVFDKLDQLGISDNTLVVFASDNGASWKPEDIEQWKHESNWGRKGMKGQIWDGGHHVPLVIRWPGHAKAGVQWDQPVCLTDIYATLAEITGQKLTDNEAEDSFSLYPVMQGKKDKIRDYVLYQSGWADLAIREGKYKFISGAHTDEYFKPGVKTLEKAIAKGELYDMENDVLETTDLSKQNPELVRSLAEKLEKSIRQGHSRPMPVQ